MLFSLLKIHKRGDDVREIKFTIDGPVQAQGRPRFGNRRAYDPKSSKDYKSHVQATAINYSLESLIETAIELHVDIYWQRPKKYSKKKSLLQFKDDLRPTTKPDLDNLVKGIKDGMTGTLWKDDSQIVSLHVHKYYSEEPRAEVKVRFE